MPHNRRKSPFRYVLKQPVAFELFILQINGQQVTPKPIEALLLDLSRSGCRISLPLEIPAKDHEVQVSITMLLHDHPLQMEGKLQWYREEAGRFHYGVQLDVLSFSRDQLLRELRLLASKDRIIIT
ncbi:PilZ domain-containing protein [Paenibacillus campi]|uniref:PilZ domain-containing protein n=1 Tax=Paenibacillus campi TaxID=3106031 RepID=UPI002AFDED68|nr:MULTISPECIES: PilZ domain-containing protein [unclassified Paenibacillus]